ncbi:MAG TPA: ABC transporter substrate-binding protein [Anaerolineales bacterium]|nr:ABC transporter substrate-binding protein [Anaerolineales bacterium]
MAVDAKAPGVGTVLEDRYRLLSEIGRGGMGTIYRAHDQALERDVAVKVVSPSELGSAGRTRLIHEARAAAQLNHPNIVTVHDVGQVDGAPFIVMELVEGASLHERPPDSTRELVRVAIQVCAALDHAHGHGVVHRDLKPENILIAPDGTAKLTDFGLALSVASRVTSEGAFTGTVFYLAPEQALGQPVDGRADLYALGVILYELSAGRLPFVADEPLAVISQHLYTPVVPPSTFNEAVPADLERVILQLVAKRPEDRPASARELSRLLEAMDLTPGRPGRAAQVPLLERIARGRLVGRERELQEARTLWQRAAAGQSQVLLISGEPGVGKTRLTRELAAQAAVGGGAVLTGECFASAGAPYAPISQILTQALDGHKPDDLELPGFVVADLITLAPMLRTHHPNVAPNPPAEPQAEQQRISESVIQLLAALSKRGPVLLAVEDAHWADGGSLALIRYLAQRIRRPDLRLMIVLTYREVELDEARALSDVLVDLHREHLATRIKLTRLTREQTGEMLGVLFQEEITPEFLDGIYRETEGNPFFIEEVCKTLIEDGVLTRAGGHWRRPDMREVRVPQSVRLAIQARLARLPEAAQEVLRRASILGREFDVDLLQAVCDVDEDGLIEALETAERAQLIEEMREARAASPRFTFVHALVPHTLAESVSGLRRQRLHRRVAEAMEKLEGDRLDELAPIIGRHFAEAGDWDKAADYLLRAGDQAQRLYAYQEAIADYEEALAVLRERKELEREARTLLKLGSLYHATFDFARSRRTYQEGFAAWQSAGLAQPAAAMQPASRPFRTVWGRADSLDPMRAERVYDNAVVEQLFGGLVERTPEMDIVPNIARAWEIHEGGLSYVFRLRPDVRWTDGMPVTARDFEVAWKRILDPAFASSNARFLNDIKGARAFHTGELSSPEGIGVRAIDPLTLSVELESPSGAFLHVLTIPGLSGIPAHVLDKHGEAWTDPAHLVSNGPFLVEAWHPGERVVLVRNPDYRGRSSGNVQRLELEFIEELDYDDLLRRYENNELEFIPIGEWKVEEFRHRHADEYVTGPQAHTEWIWMRWNHPPFEDRRVRQAFVHACDREAMVVQRLRGLDPPGTGGLVPLGMPGHQPGIGLPFDPDRARRLLAEAGYPGGRGLPEIEFMALAVMGESPHLSYLCEQWKDVLGVEVRRSAVSFPEYLRRNREAPPALSRHAWLADYPDPDNFLRVGLSYAGDVRWSEEYAGLVEAAGRSSDQRQRMALYARADRLLVQEAVVMPLTYGRFDILIKPWVRRYPFSPVGFWFWKDVVMEEGG